MALPTEHGGWGFLLEPLVLGLAVAASAGGVWIAVAFVCAFLVRQPLRLALQDVRRGRYWPRTAWCWLFATVYATGAALSMISAIAVAGPAILVPLLVAVPLAAVQIAFDARNRSRALLAELAGATAMSSSAAAIAIAAGANPATAFGLAAVIVARSLPSIVYVRTLLRRARGESPSHAPVIVLHLMAVSGVALIGSPPAVAAMVLLLARAFWQLDRPVPRAQKIGWMEIAFGAVTVLLVVLGA